MKNRMKMVLSIGVLLAVMLLLGTAFSGSVYAERTSTEMIKSVKTTNPVWIKNGEKEKIFSFNVGNTKISIHYEPMAKGKYSVEITSYTKNGKKYSANYMVDRNTHKVYVNGHEARISKITEQTTVNTLIPLRGGIHYKWWDGIYDVYGYPQIKYMHPDRNYYDIGTWENELLIGNTKYHVQIGTDSIGWITQLPPEVAGAAIGAIIGALVGGIGAVVGAVVGVIVGFIAGNIIQDYVCDETGAGWAWINIEDIQKIINAMYSWWPWQHWVHIDYFKLGELGPYSMWVDVPYA